MELDRAKKKIQRSTIIKHGYACCELWTAAIDVFSIARKLYVISPSHITTSAHAGKTPYNSPTAYAPTTTFPGLFEQQRSKLQDDLTEWSHDSPMRSVQAIAGSQESGLGSNTNQSDVLWVGNAAFDLSRLAATPPLSANKMAKLRRKQRQNENVVPTQGLELAPEMPVEVNVEPQQPQDPDNVVAQKYIDWQKRQMRHLARVQGGASDGYRDTSLRSHLPLTVCQLILPYVVDDRTLDLLSARQQKKVLEWGQLHDSLSTEIDWRNRDKASQVWMLLEALECLEQE